MSTYPRARSPLVVLAPCRCARSGPAASAAIRRPISRGESDARVAAAAHAALAAAVSVMLLGMV